MSLIAFAQTLQATALGLALREASPPVILAIQIGHVLGLVLLLTTLLLVNLRLLGWGLARQPLRQLVDSTRWSLRLGLLLAALVLQASLYRFVTVREPVAPLLARTTAVLSLSLWFSVGLAGRAIGFV
jgi:tellurite resistance protein TehA-like permease